MSEERRHGDYSIRHFAHEALHDLLHFDNKFLRSLRPLLFRPGSLTTEYFADGQSRYMKPLALFIFLNFLFFVVKVKSILNYRLSSFTSDWARAAIDARIALSGLSREVFEATFDTAMKYQQKGYIIFLVPLLAFVLQLLFVRQRRYFVEHLVFSLHFFGFVLIHLAVVPTVLSWIRDLLALAGAGFRITDDFLVGVLFFSCAAWLWFAFRRVYASSRLGATVKSVLVSFALLLLISYVYRYGLFWLVLRSIG